MKLIEKKCPNCGASLSFSETDKSCKCEYCHREFEIERDEKIIQDESRDNFDAYSLIDPETAKKVAKTGLAVFAATSIIPLIIFVIVFCIIAFVIFKGVSTSVHEQQNKTQEEISKTIAINDVNKLKNTELKYLSDKSYSALSVKGEGGTKYSYQNEDHEVYKYIGAYKDKKNYIYVVQKVLYVNFFNVKDKKTVFIPVRYENVYSGIKWSDDETEEIVNGSVVDAPKYYLNKDPELYVRGGYATYEEFYKDKIDPLKADGYKITEK